MSKPDDPPHEVGARGRVLLIGWDAADWKAIQPLIEAGKMPTLRRFIEGGVWGRIATLRPIYSPMLWTSIATGVRPYRHGIHGFCEPDPDAGGVRPITNLNRRVRALWNMLTLEGMKSNVVGWWPSHPAEPINGAMVSNHYQRATRPRGKPWPMPPGTVHPARLAGPLARLRVHPAELEAGHILPFVPRAAEIDTDKDKRLESLAKTIADSASVHAAATALMQLEPWDFMAVYYDAIDHFGHGFMKYHPPRQGHVDEQDFEMYKGVIEAGYRYHDMMLGALLNLAGPDTTVILMSDHGFHPDHLRPARVPHEPAGPAFEHSPYGIVAMRGPGIRQGERLYGAGLLDIAPTVLTLFGLPVGKDMQGKPLLQAFKQPPEVETIISWELVQGEDGSHPKDTRLDPEEARQSLRQLVDLGYIEDPGEDADTAARNTVRELNYNLAQAYIDDNLYDKAVAQLEKLWADFPDEVRFARHLVHCYQTLGRTADLRRVVDELIEARRRLALEARDQIKAFRDLIEQRRAERDAADASGDVPLDDRAMDEAIDQAGDGRRAGLGAPALNEAAQEQEGEKGSGEDHKPLLTPQEAYDLEKWRSLAVPGGLLEPYLRGVVAMAEGDDEAAVALLTEVVACRPRSVDLHLTIGQLLFKLGDRAGASQAFEAALSIDPDQPVAHLGLCRCATQAKDHDSAVAHGLEAVGLNHHYPEGHHVLGVALHRAGHIDQAVQALRLAVQMNPGLIRAHRRLAYLYRHRLNEPGLARRHADTAKQLRINKAIVQPLIDRELARLPAGPTRQAEAPGAVRLGSVMPTLAQRAVPDAQVVTVVSGLPRSGTSMMMQMLATGGMPPLTDARREADADNPHGYLEFEKAKSLMKDRAWVAEARGKAVKVVAQLLPYLPNRLAYRVVFLERDLDEVIRSQRVMLDRQGKRGAELDADRLKASFSRQLRQARAWLENQNVPCLVVSYRDAVDSPLATAKRVAAFLPGHTDPQAMAAAIDQTLYRQRGGED